MTDVGLILDQEDEEYLKSIQFDLDKEIPWGEVGEELKAVVLERLHSHLFLGEGSSPPPVEGLLPGAQNFLLSLSRGEDLQRVICLRLALKALGNAKTKIKRELERIVEVVDAGKEDLEAAELHMRDIVGQRTEGSGAPMLRMTERDRLKEEEIDREIEARLDQSEVTCQHLGSVTIRYDKGNGILQRVCRACRTELTPIRQKLEPAFSEKEQTPYFCRHERIKWVPGKEGKEAQCSTCLDPYPNPANVKWTAAGLEPYGDDPSTDEILELP